MKKIKYHDKDWNEYDELDGKALSDGEKIRILWPDGRTRLHTVKTQVNEEHFMEQGGHDASTTIERVFVEAKVYGHKALVPIVGLWAERVKK